MKLRGGIIGLAVLLVAGLLITPVLGSTNQAGYQIKSSHKNLDTITIDFVDCTGTIPVKKEITLSKAEWKSISTELQTIAASGITMKEAFAAQVAVLQQHHLLLEDVNANTLFNKFSERSNTEKMRLLQNRIHPAPINNTLFSIISAISFTLENGTTVVLGLNSFINYIGFDIISFHKGYATGGIQTNGMITKSVPPGTYIGFMFGFFGYWFGQKTSTAVYSSVTVSGLTFITFWLPL
jgi:hypothetical protein